MPLRWGDMDAQKHVNNSMFAEYLQEARVDFLHAAGVTEMLETGVVVVSHQIEYLGPITYSPEPVIVDLGITQIGAARFEVSYLISHDNRLCARARSVLCPFDLASQSLRRLTPDERDWFEQHRIDVEPFRRVAAVPLEGRGAVHLLRPRWSDVDRFGHVNNVRLFDYVQEARISVFPVDSRAVWLVARQDVDFIAQIPYRVQPYRVHVAPVHVGSSSTTFATEVCDPLEGDRLLARASTVLVHADERGRPTPLPDDIREKLARDMLTP